MEPALTWYGTDALKQHGSGTFELTGLGCSFWRAFDDSAENCVGRLPISSVLT
jgi:hypothetical protein